MEGERWCITLTHYKTLSSGVSHIFLLSHFSFTLPWFFVLYVPKLSLKELNRFDKSSLEILMVKHVCNISDCLSSHFFH